MLSNSFLVSWQREYDDDVKEFLVGAGSVKVDDVLIKNACTSTPITANVRRARHLCVAPCIMSLRAS